MEHDDDCGCEAPNPLTKWLILGAIVVVAALVREVLFARNLRQFDPRKVGESVNG